MFITADTKTRAHKIQRVRVPWIGRKKWSEERWAFREHIGRKHNSRRTDKVICFGCLKLKNEYGERKGKESNQKKKIKTDKKEETGKIDRKEGKSNRV